MAQKSSSKGFTVVETVIVVLVVAAFAFTVWFIWGKTYKKDNTNTNPKTAQNHQQEIANKDQQTTDQSDGGKYLVIKEWGVRVELPAAEQGKTTYVLGDVTTDPTGNQVQAAKILIAKSALAANECEAQSSSIGEAYQSGAQYIRSESAKSFDETRYKTPFKKNILIEDSKAYHLNYLTPDCLGGNNVSQIEQLQAALLMLKKVEQ